jgi:hypothetical protein
MINKRSWDRSLQNIEDESSSDVLRRWTYLIWLLDTWSSGVLTWRTAYAHGASAPKAFHNPCVMLSQGSHIPTNDS